MLPYVYVITSTAPMRAESRSDAEVVSQALFAERVHVHEETGGWCLVETLCDGYRGWVMADALLARSTPYPAAPELTVTISRNAAHVYSVEDTIYGPILTLPYESQLEIRAPVVDGSRWLPIVLPDQRAAFVQRGDVTVGPSPRMSRMQMLALSHQFLGLPYTWGGRSSFGYDCSGFVQMLYRQMGVALPRDARQQIQWEGFMHGTRAQLKPGDLLFFGADASRIQHVGMALDNQRFIHATVTENAPYLRISDWSDSTWREEGGRYAYHAARLFA